MRHGTRLARRRACFLCLVFLSPFLQVLEKWVKDKVVGTVAPQPKL
jgi:hypothetical protein